MRKMITTLIFLAMLVISAYYLGQGKVEMETFAWLSGIGLFFSSVEVDSRPKKTEP